MMLLALLSLSFFGVLTSAQTTREQFASLAASQGGVIKLNSKTFDAITAPERDWSVVIQMTALVGAYKCEPCHIFQPSFNAVAKSWKTVPKSKRDQHFFATLDFEQGQDIFRRMGLNSAPFVYFYPATKGPLLEAHPKKDRWTYDFGTHSFDPEILARELSPHTPTRIPYSPPLNYKLYVTAMTTLLGGYALYYLLGPVLIAFVASRWIWGVASLALIVTMISGFMFVRIRGTPYAAQVRGPQGLPVLNYIAGGYQNQYGAETQMIGGLYSVLAISQVALILFAPRLPSAGRQRAAVYIWLAVSWMLFSVLVAIFKLKHSGYPFRLLL